MTSPSTERGGLTDRDREWLQGEKEYDAWQSDERARREVRDRLAAAIADLAFFEDLDTEDNETLDELHEEIFEEVHPETLRDALAFIMTGVLKAHPRGVDWTIIEAINESAIETDAELAPSSHPLGHLGELPTVDYLLDNLDDYEARRMAAPFEEDLTPREMAKIKQQQLAGVKIQDRELENKDLTLKPEFQEDGDE